MKRPDILKHQSVLGWKHIILYSLAGCRIPELHYNLNYWKQYLINRFMSGARCSNMTTYDYILPTMFTVKKQIRKKKLITDRYCSQH